MQIRCATILDVQALTRLFEDYDVHMLGMVETSEDDTKNILHAITDLEIHSWVAEENGHIIGFAGVTEGGDKKYPSIMIVHPSAHNMGIEKQLLKRMNDSITNGTITVSSNNSYEHKLFEENGYHPIRYWYTMMINFEEGRKPVHSPVPDGIIIKPFTLNQDEEATYHAFEESFQTHFDYTPSSFEDFLQRTKREGFDPNLWLVAKENDEIVGFIFGKRTVEQHGEITHLGILPKWRRKGLAKLLLNSAFELLINENRSIIQLHVDSGNGTAAVKVYEAVGMKISKQFVRYDKVINS